ncbi:MAG: hypothetical protein ACE5JP_07425 [Candidatus Bipolaricaulia bacterium]
MNKVSRVLRGVNGTAAGRRMLFVSLVVLMALSLMAAWGQSTLGQFVITVLEEEVEGAGGLLVIVTVPQQHIGTGKVRFVRKPLGTLEEIGMGSDDFTPRWLVARIALLDDESGRPLREFAPVIILQVELPDGVERANLGFYNGLQWVPFEGVQFRDGFGVVQIERWEFLKDDPPIAWGE